MVAEFWGIQYWYVNHLEKRPAFFGIDYTYCGSWGHGNVEYYGHRTKVQVHCKRYSGFREIHLALIRIIWPFKYVKYKGEIRLKRLLRFFNSPFSTHYHGLSNLFNELNGIVPAMSDFHDDDFSSMLFELENMQLKPIYSSAAHTPDSADRLSISPSTQFDFG